MLIYYFSSLFVLTLLQKFLEGTMFLKTWKISIQQDLEFLRIQVFWDVTLCHQEPLTQQPSVTSEMTWIFSNSAVRNTHLTFEFFFHFWIILYSLNSVTLATYIKVPIFIKFYCMKKFSCLQIFNLLWSHLSWHVLFAGSLFYQHLKILLADSELMPIFSPCVFHIWTKVIIFVFKA